MRSEEETEKLKIENRISGNQWTNIITNIKIKKYIFHRTHF